MPTLAKLCRASIAAFLFTLALSASQSALAQTTGAIISELRVSGPSNGEDEFYELYNTTDANIVVQASDSSSGWSIAKTAESCTNTPRRLVIIPNGTTIPARGHYLVRGALYSLRRYAAGDQRLVDHAEADRNVALFNTSNVSNYSLATRLDAIGFGTNVGGNCDLLREGTNLPSSGESTSQYSFVRRMESGFPQDTDNNASDFIVVSTTPEVAVGGNTPILGAPGPENTTSPIQRNAGFTVSLIEPSQPASAPPNRVRDPDDTAGGTGNQDFGTLKIRRHFTNNTGNTVTRLRVRAVSISTRNSPPQFSPQADLRLLSSSDEAITPPTSIGVSMVNGTTLEMPPAQPQGGGLNSSLNVVLPAGGLAPGASIDLQIVLGVEQNGTFFVFVNIEALP